MIDTGVRRTQYAIINASKTVLGVALAYIIGCFLGEFLGMPEMYKWMIITVIVVMSTQPNIGGAIDKAIMRLLGTISSAVICISLLCFVSIMWLKVLLSLPIIFIAVYIAGRYSKYSYAGTLAAITAVIILINDQPGFNTAIYRASEIAIGILIAITINRYVFPIRAETRLKNNIARTIIQIRDLYDVLFNEHIELHTAMMGEIFANFTKQITYIKEMKYEHHSKKVKEFKKMNLYLRRLYRYMVVMYEYVEISLGSDYLEKLRDEPAFVEFKRYMITVLTDVAQSIENREKIDYRKTIDFDRYILPHLKNIEMLNKGDGIFIFYSERLLNSLQLLAMEYNYIIRISKH